MRVFRFAAAVLLAAACVAFSSCAGNKTSDTSAENTPATQAVTAAKSAPVDAAWFDDAVFVGDSVTLKLSYFCEENPDALGNAQFFCAGSLGYGSALWDIDDPDAVHPFYQGDFRLAEDCAEVTGASKVFIMLGMNDIGLYGVDDSVKSCEQLVSNIKKKSPSATIYIQSVTPMIAAKEAEYDDLSNAMIRDFNTKVEAFCRQSGIKYLDVYTVVADENGCLRDEFCGDAEAMGIHFTDAACELWANYLKENVK